MIKPHSFQPSLQWPNLHQYWRMIGCLRLSSLLRLFGVITLAALLAAPLPAAAQSSDGAGPWVGDPAFGQARLISAVTGTGQLERLPLGLEFRLAPGWKIYWRTPGEAGLPPELDLRLASGEVLQTEIEWPVPKRFNAFGFDNFGYAKTVILPVGIRGHMPGAAVQISGQLEALVCADICVPLAGDVQLDLADGPAEPSSMAMPIAQFQAKVPRLGAASSLEITSLWQDGAQLKAAFRADQSSIDDIFVEGAPGIAFKKPVIDGDVAVIALEGDVSAPLAGQALDLTVVAGDDFLMRKMVVGASAETSSANRDGKPGKIWTIIALAFLGGLILNLMPCVLPVLAIKLAAIIESSGQSRGFVRLRFGAGAMGIITSFALLAAGLAALRFAGGQIGWGIQFQSPIFLTVMLLVLGLFTLNMLDRFFLPVPAFLSAGAARAGHNNGGSGRGTVLFGDFMAGMLATLLATPCSAPFVGSAVTVALTGDMAQLFAVFMAMGAGLAAPWGLVVLFPALVGLLPRPGHWMVWLKRALAGLLIITMIWLGWLLFTVQGGTAAVLVLLLLILLLAAILFRIKLMMLGASLGLFLGLMFLPAPAAVKQQMAGIDWQQWSPAASAVAREQGKLVLVDVTADWCITCKANKTLVLEAAPIGPLLRTLANEDKLVMLKADWTRPDPAIASFLASHGRFGIPFNIIYGPKANDGIVLGELLNANMVESALIKAGMAR